MSYDSSSGNGTSAIPVITAVYDNILLCSAVIADFPAVAIPELTGCTNFFHVGTAVNVG